MEFWRFLAATHISRAICTEITRDRRDSLRMKLSVSALNVVFTRLNFTPPYIQGILCTPYGVIKLGYHLQNTCIWPLEQQWPCEMVAPSDDVNASYPM